MTNMLDGVDTDHLWTLFHDAHWRSLDNICSHPLNAEQIEDFFPKSDDDIDFLEEVWETVPPAVYAKSFFDQCAKEIGFHSIKEGVSLDAIPSYTTEKAPALTAGKNPDTGELANF